jgi:hypothetical protein
MNTLSEPPGHVWFLGPEVRPWLEWRDHTNDLVNYTGENGTKLALEQARTAAEMMLYDPGYRYGDFICGNGLQDEENKVIEEMKANGTWVALIYPFHKRKVKWECRNWEECWRAWPWKWQSG